MIKSNLHIHTVPSLGEPVGTLWREVQAEYTQTGNFHVAAPLSGTPIPIYDWIVDNKMNFSSWDKASFVLMDEQVEGASPPYSYVDINDPASYEGFAKKKFLKPLGENVTLLKPDLGKLDDCNLQIDLLILALGIHGNYANVMPGTPIETGWHIARLTPEFKQVHTNAKSESYSGASFREYGMSLGPQQVLQAKNVIVIISGQYKQTLTNQLLRYSAFDPDFPLSIIYNEAVRNRVQLFLTEDVL
jgi:6-phosphogluconolactonase/glucosamine-6-phosphate isomerase/deaminase